MPENPNNQEETNYLDNLDSLIEYYKVEGTEPTPEFEANIHPRVGEFQLTSEYDEGIRAGQNQQALRAERQSGVTQGFNSVAGGIAMGLATAVEDASYILDFDNHIKAIEGVDTWEKNWLAEAMTEFKEDVREGMPIYRQNSEVMDWSDPGFYWESLRGVIDSAVGFGLPGGAIAKGVGAGLKASRAAKLIELATKSEKGVRATEALGAGFIQNYAEGKIMGIETYEETYANLIDNGVEVEKARELAGQAADDMLLNNRAMILTDAFSLYGLTKGIGTTRNLLKERGFKNRFKQFGQNLIAPNADNLILQGGKESAEEIAQNVIQMEAQYKAAKKAGIDTDAPEDTLDRLIGFANSDQALLEGMMGFFGGGPQRILSELTSGRFAKTAQQQYKDRYNEQQRVIGENADYLSRSTNIDADLVKARDDFYQAGEEVKGDAINTYINDDRIIANAAAGTLETYENQLQEHISSGKDESGQAAKALSRIPVLEKEWINNASKANVSQIIRNRSKYDLAKEYLKSTDNDINTKAGEVKQYIDDVLVPDRFTYNIDDITSNPYDKKVDPGAYKNYNTFVEKVKSLEGYKELEKLKQDRKGISKRVSDLQEEYFKLKKPEAEQSFINTQQDIADKVAKQKQEEQEEVDIKTTTLDPKGKYRDKAGATWEYMSTDSEGNHTMRKASSPDEQFQLFSPDEFDRKFVKEDGSLTKKVNEEVVQDTNKEKGAEEAAQDARDKKRAGEPTTKSEEIAASTEEKISDELLVEPSNEETTDEELDQTLDTFKTKDPLALAWASVNNPSVEYGNDDITSFLENRNIALEGRKVKLTIDKDQTNDKDFNSYLQRNNLSKAKQDALKQRLIDSSGIKVDILNDDGTVATENNTPISLYLHLPNYRPEAEYSEQMTAFRKEVVDSLFKSAAQRSTIYSRITKKGPGTIQRGDNANLKVVLQEENVNKIKLAVRVEGGALSLGLDKDGNKVWDKDLDKFENPKAPLGTIFTKVPMSNNEAFPMRLNVSNITDEEASVIFDIYSELLEPTGVFNPLVADTDLYEKVRTGSERLAGILDVLPEEATLLQLLNELVYNGEYTMDTDYPLHIKDGAVYYGRGNKGKPNFFRNDTKLEKRDLFIDWLKKNKLRNINFKQINDNKYKGYLIDNNIIESNAEYNEQGPIFAQPTITISETLSDTSSPSKEVKAKGLEGENIVIQNTSSLLTEALQLQDLEQENIKQQVKVTNDDLTNFEGEMRTRYSTTAVEQAGPFKEFYDSVLEVLPDQEKALVIAKQKYEEQVKNCL